MGEAYRITKNEKGEIIGMEKVPMSEATKPGRHEPVDLEKSAENQPEQNEAYSDPNPTMIFRKEDLQKKIKEKEGEKEEESESETSRREDAPAKANVEKIPNAKNEILSARDFSSLFNILDNLERRGVEVGSSGAPFSANEWKERILPLIKKVDQGVPIDLQADEDLRKMTSTSGLGQKVVDLLNIRKQQIALGLPVENIPDVNFIYGLDKAA